MLLNYIKIALRNLQKQKSYSIINILGFSLGIAAAIVILLYVRYQLSYDRFHANAENMYRVVVQQPGRFYLGSDVFCVTPAPLGPAMVDEFSDVLSYTRIRRHLKQYLFKHGDTKFLEDKVYWADTNFFEMFSFPLLRGNPQTVLEDPYSIVLSSTLAQKYFGDQDPIGEKLLLENREFYTVTGIFQPVPHNTHFEFELLASFNSLAARYGEERMQSWGSSSYFTYVTLNESCDHKELGAKLFGMVQKHHDHDNETNYILQPVPSIHLNSHSAFELSKNGSMTLVYLFSVMAFVILFIACVNYINLTTALSENRMREAGMRKVIGAKRTQLMRQFISESILFCLFAVVLALVLVEIFRGPLSNWLSIYPHVLSVFNIKWVPLFFALGLVVGVISGVYPALYMTSAKPVFMLKGTLFSAKKSILRNTLVVFQFAASIAMIASIIVIQQQLHFIRTTDVGFAKEQILVMQMRDIDLIRSKRVSELKHACVLHENVLLGACSSYLPNNITEASGDFTWEGAGDQRKTAYRIEVDHDFLDVFEIDLVQGRNFPPDLGDGKTAYIINRTASQEFGVENSIGREIGYLGRGMGPLVGIVEDFHFNSLYSKVKPAALLFGRERFEFISLKVKTENLAQTIRFLEKTYAQFSPDYPFEYFFFDQYFDQTYKAETNMAKVVNAFALLAVLVACLGLFGLASYSIQKRAKEIGIRKSLGASEQGIRFMLAREFTKWVLLANIIAWPVAFYILSMWLQNFAYHITLGPLPFLIAGFGALLVALLTVISQAGKAAKANPIEILRYE